MVRCVLDQRCQDIENAVADGDAAAIQAAVGPIWEAAQGRDAAELTVAVGRLSELLPLVPGDIGSGLAVLGGAMVEDGRIAGRSPPGCSPPLPSPPSSGGLAPRDPSAGDPGVSRYPAGPLAVDVRLRPADRVRQRVPEPRRRRR
jgi:hypothetical protein